MLLNYLKLSLRLLARNPFFTLINVLGLAIGFASFFVLWEYASSELKTDQYHPNHERIARLGVNWGSSKGYIKVGWLDPRTAHRIKTDYPEVEDEVRILYQGEFSRDLVGHESRVVLSSGKTDGSKTIFNENKIVYADPNLFKFFSIPLLHGEKNDVLRDPNTVALSSSMAYKYFGKENSFGELLILNGSTTLKVTGVFEDLPRNTHLDFDFVISNASKTSEWNRYTFPFTQCFVLLKEGTDFKSFEDKVNGQGPTYWKDLLQYRPGLNVTAFVQPLKDVAFSNHYYGDHFRTKSKSLLITFSVVSVVILMLAWINYTNLTLARTARRLKELAARKTAGARSIDFLKQFLIESILTNLIALALAFTLLQVVRGPINVFLHLFTPGFNSTSLSSVLFLTAVVLMGVIVTGLYPAMMAIRHNPRSLLSSKTTSNGSSGLPAVLTLFQYASAIVLLLWAFVVYLQLSFLFSKGLGAGTESIAIIESPIVRNENLTRQIEYFQNRLSALNLIEDATSAYTIDLSDNLSIRKSLSSTPVGAASNGGVSESFIPFFGIHLIAGRNFRLSDRADGVIVSLKIAGQLGFSSPHDAIGAKVYIARDSETKIMYGPSVEIIGVISDYRTSPYLNFDGNNSSTAQEGDVGICMTYKDYLFSSMTPERLALKLDTKNLSVTIPKIEKLFNEIFPGNAFVLFFQDDHIEGQYEDEKTTRNQLVFFTLLAIGIACLGLLGMISNKLNEKIKEIGVRKVLGAKIHHIAAVLMSSTIRQFAIANALSIPLAYYFIQQYLEKFSARITLPWWYYTIPGAILLGIMLATVASVLFRAIRTNPVESLRSE